MSSTETSTRWLLTEGACEAMFWAAEAIDTATVMT